MRINRIDIKNESQRLIRSINSNTCGGLPPLCNRFDEPYSLIYGWGDYPKHVTSQNNSAEEQARDLLGLGFYPKTPKNKVPRRTTFIQSQNCQTQKILIKLWHHKFSICALQKE